MLVLVSVLVFVSVLGQRGAGSGKRGAGSGERRARNASRSTRSAHAKRQPDTHTSTDTGSLTAPIGANFFEADVDGASSKVPCRVKRADGPFR